MHKLPRTILSLLLILCMLPLMPFSGPVYAAESDTEAAGTAAEAADPAAEDDDESNIPYGYLYDPVISARNEKKVYQYLTTEMGLNTAAACGIMASMVRECAFIPDILSEDSNAYGLCMWYKPMKEALFAFCDERGLKRSDLMSQLQFLKYDMETRVPKYLAHMQKVKNNQAGAYDAGYFFAYWYERPITRVKTSKARGNRAAVTFWPKYKKLAARYKQEAFYAPVFNAAYYLDRYPDLRLAFGTDEDAAFTHFLNCGMKEGRQGSADFSVSVYQNRYADLRSAYGSDNRKYYEHYLNYGIKENRSGAGAPTLWNGLDYADVFSADYYLARYPDLQKAFGTDQAAAFRHFVLYGMKERRQACAEFDVRYYVSKYADLRTAYGEDWAAYYRHYIRYGKKEGRQAAA